MLRAWFSGVLMLIAMISLRASEYSFAFVHLGSPLPSYACTIIEQARYMNPEVDIYLILDGKAFSTIDAVQEAFFERCCVRVINGSQLEESDIHKAFKKTGKLNNDWRNGFWNNATERFFYLYDFLIAYDVHNVVHLENDVMLYVDLDEIKGGFEELNAQLAVPFEWVHRCIPSFVYIRNCEAFAPLLTHIVEELQNYRGHHADAEINDMSTLSSFGHRYGQRMMTSLPIVMPDYARFYPKQIVPFPLEAGTTLAFISQNYNAFKGYIFDAAALGIYAGGYDRRNQPNSKPGAVHAKSLFDPRHFKFYWGKDSAARRVPCIRFKGADYRIVNLHFHSKMPEGFTSFRETVSSFPSGF